MPLAKNFLGEAVRAYCDWCGRLISTDWNESDEPPVCNASACIKAERDDREGRL